MKKVASLIGLGVLALGLISGCGTSSTAGNGSSTGSGGGGEIKIGADLEVTGGVATFGSSVKNALTMAFDEQNKKGGVLGKQLKLVIADNKSDAGESTSAITKLITQDKVAAVIGAVTSSDTLAASPVATDNKVPLLTPTATNAKVTVENGQLKPWIFRSCFLDPFQGRVAANFALNELKVKTAAVYVDQKDDYSKGLAEEFKKVFTEGGGKITTTENYVGGDKDFRAVLTRIKSGNPELVFVPGYYNEVGLIINQARGMSMNMPFLGGDGWDSAKLAEVAGATNLNKAYFVNHMWSEDPNTKPFVEAYKEKYGAEPDALAALGYDAAKMMISAIEKAGSADPAKIREALEQTKDFQGVTGTMTIDPATHNPVKSAVIIQLVDGKKTLLTHIKP